MSDLHPEHAAWKRIGADEERALIVAYLRGIVTETAIVMPVTVTDVADAVERGDHA